MSISGGVAAITSAYPSLIAAHGRDRASAPIFLLMLVNLRGVRESGIAFSVPTYVFIAMMLALIGFGLWRLLFRATPSRRRAADVARPSARTVVSRSALRSRSSSCAGSPKGCVAMTGTEAISNGVSAFKAPSAEERRDHARLDGGDSRRVLPRHELSRAALRRDADGEGDGALAARPPHLRRRPAVLRAAVRDVRDPRARREHRVRRLSRASPSILARDSYMPRQFAARGDRLAFSNGIIALALVAMLLVWLFHGDTSALIPLYAIGVFVCFTLSQAGMVVHWLRSKEPGLAVARRAQRRRRRRDGVVSIVQVVTKFTHGAWIVVLIIPLIILLLRSHSIGTTAVSRSRSRTRAQSPLMFLHHTVVVPVNGITKATAGALVYATTISEDVRAVYIEVDPRRARPSSSASGRRGTSASSWRLPSPYRSIVRPLVDYVDRASSAATPGALVTVVVPEIVPRHWWEHLLHNKTALFIRTAFLFQAERRRGGRAVSRRPRVRARGEGPRWTAEASVTHRRGAARRKNHLNSQIASGQELPVDNGSVFFTVRRGSVKRPFSGWCDGG